MFVWTMILMGMAGGDADVTKIPVGERIAYADKLANRFRGRNAWNEYEAAIAAHVPVYELYPDGSSLGSGKHLAHLNSNLNALGEARRWTPEQAGAIAKYLEANEETLKLLARASRRRRCFIPLAAAGKRLHQTAIDLEKTVGFLAFTRLMKLKSNECALKGGWKEAFQWNVRIHRMADHLFQQVFSIQLVVPMGIETIANVHTLGLFRREFPTNWRELIEKSQTLDKRHSTDDVVDAAEALWTWDYLESWHEWAEDQDRHPDLTDLAKMFVKDGGENVGTELLEEMFPDLLAESQFQDVEALRSAIKRVTLEQEWQIDRKLARMHARWRSRPFNTAWKQVEEFEREYCELMMTSPSLSIAGCGQMQTSHFVLMFRIAEVQRHGPSLVGGVLAHRRARGALPRELGELVPEFLEQLPTDPFSGDPYVYRITDGVHPI